MLALEAAARRRGPVGGHQAGRGDRRLVGARRLRARGAVGRLVPADRARVLRRDRRATRAHACRAASASSSSSTCCSRPTPTCCCSTSPTTSSTSRPSCELEQRIRVVQEDDRDDLPRPRGAGRRARLDRDARGQRRLGARRLLRHLPAGARGPPAAPRRRRQALARGGAPAVPADEDVQGARALRAGLGQEGRRDGDRAGGASARPARRRRRSPTRRSPCASAAATRRGSCSTSGRWRSPTSSRRSPTRSTSASASASSAPTGRARAR